MVVGPTRLALLALALAIPTAWGIPFRQYGYTPLPTISYAHHGHHPIFGGKPAADMPKPVCPDNLLDGNPVPDHDPDQHPTARRNQSRHAAKARHARAPDVQQDQVPGKNQDPRQDQHQHARQLETSSSVDIQRLESFFSESMIRNIDTLQATYSKGQAPRVPWPGSYWPTYQDSINLRWYSSSELSPAEKYAKAYGLDPTKFMNDISAENGIDSCDWCSTCTRSSQCDYGETCSKRRGRSSGRCISTWWGICHAWAPAAILELEPRCPVTVGGVTFRAKDIKALITLLYDGLSIPVVFTGARYDGYSDAVDAYGRYKSSAERDLGPGFFHIAVTNLMGRKGQSFVVDIEATSEVWNQPVRSYEVTSFRKMSPSDAAWEFFGLSKYRFNTAAYKVAYVSMAFKYIEEGYSDGAYVSTGNVDGKTITVYYEYLLELDRNNNIIGGEWLYDSQTRHPDFLWWTTRKPKAGSRTSFGLDYDTVAKLISLSNAANC